MVQGLGQTVGEATEVDAIHVRFPGGKQVDFAGPFPVGERVWVYESGAALVGDVEHQSISRITAEQVEETLVRVLSEEIPRAFD